MFNADGYQTYDRILCTTAMSKNQLILQIKSYEDGKTANEIGVEQYKVSETLFSLEKSTAKNEKEKKSVYPPLGCILPFLGRTKKCERLL